MKIGAAQIRFHLDFEKNLKNISHWMRMASEQGVDILNFPETSLTGYLYETFSDVRQEDIASGIDQLGTLTQKLGISAVVGTPYWLDDRLFNSVVVLLADGRRFLYHKNNLVSYEEEYFVPGTDLLSFDIEELRFGTIICRDQSFPGLAQRIKEEGGNVLFISCAHFYPPMQARLKVEKNRALPIARACENGVFVCKANAVGSYRGRVSLGHSLLIGPNGVVISEAGETGEELLAFDVDEFNLDWTW